MREPPCWPVAPKTVRSLLILDVFCCAVGISQINAKVKGIDELCSRLNTSFVHQRSINITTPEKASGTKIGYVYALTNQRLASFP